MKYISLLILTVFLLSNFSFAQNCGLDTSFCYSTEQYPPVTFGATQSMQSVPNTVVFNTPLVVDINSDCVPEIIIAGTNGFLANPRITSGITILNSTTGATMSSFPTVYYSWSCPLSYAIGDINLDGFPEIIVAAANHTNNAVNLRRKLVCYDFSGNVLWVSNQTYGNNTSMQFEGTPSLADFNQDGIAEVYVHNQIFNAQTGVLLADGGANGIGRMVAVSPYYEICLTAAADLDSNPNDLELAAGYTIYNVQISNTFGTAGNILTPYNITVDGALRDGMTSFGDINLDGKLDVVVASEGTETTSRLYAYYLNSSNVPVLIARTPMPRGTNAAYSTFCGAPFIGDLDGIGVPSICVTRNYRLVAYSYNGSTTFQQKWVINTIDQSGATGITSFDFDQNGIQELVFRDEQDMRIINGNGSTPTTLSVIPCSSPTVNDMAIVADIDNTGTSKICVTCGNNNTAKLKVYASNASVPWAPSRKIWNQYGYHVFNINDDATVPQFQLNNATANGNERNNYFVQASLLDSNGNMLVPAAEASGIINCITNDLINNVLDIDFEITNALLASQILQSGCVVSFFDGNPETNGVFLGNTIISSQLNQGNTISGNYQITSPPAITNGFIYMVVNNNGSVSGNPFIPQNFILRECDYTNNISSFPFVSVNAGTDIINCGLQTVTLSASQSSTFQGNWQVVAGSGSFSAVNNPGSTFTTNGYGQNTLNWMVQNNGCVLAIDEVLITSNPIPIVVPSSDVTIASCTSDSVQIGMTINANYSYLWAPNTWITSSTAAQPFVFPTFTTVYIEQVLDPLNNCVNFDTVLVTVSTDPGITPINDTLICAGSLINLSYNSSPNYSFNWQPFNISGSNLSEIIDSTTTVQVNITNSLTGCNSNDVFTVSVWNYSPLTLNNINICEGDGFQIIFSPASNIDYFISIDSINFIPFDPSTIYTPMVSGYYQVLSNNTFLNCSSIDTFYFNVNSVPVVNAGPDQMICANTSIILTGNGASLYTWNNNVTNNISFFPTTSQSYVVTGTNNSGCINMDTIFVTVNPLPIANSGPDQAICQGEQVTLTSTSGNSISWSNGVIDGIPFTPTNSEIFTLTITDGMGCVNSDSVFVEVYPIPNVNAGTDQTVCVGNSVTLLASGASIYSWDNGISNGISFEADTVNSIIYTVTGTSSDGCINLDEVLVSVIPSPIVNAGLDTIICLGNSYFLNAFSPTSDLYIWNNGFSNGTEVYPGAGINQYIVQTTTSNGCTAWDTVLVNVIPIPNANFQFYPQEIIESNTTINFINLSSESSTYMWIFNQSDSTNIFSPSYFVESIEEDGLNVTLIVMNNLGCIDSIAIFIPYLENTIIYVPNCFTPDGDEFNNTFNVKYSGSISSAGFEFLIYDRWGELIYESNNIDEGWDGTYLGKLVQDGTYTWKITYHVTTSDDVIQNVGHVTLIR